MAGIDADGHLIHFSRPLGFDWWVDDVTEITGRRVIGPICFYHDSTSSGDLTQWWEHLVARGSDGHLLVFQEGLLQADWQVTDLTTTTGAAMEGMFTTWGSIAQDTGTCHIAGVRRN